MSVRMTKADGVTMLTMSSDTKSACPPLCQIFKALCYSPVCCSVSQQMRRVQKTSQSALGALQILAGLVNIGLGPILWSIRNGPWWIVETDFPFWLGGLFITFGIMCILSEKFPSLCMVIINVILNLIGVAFAITGIVAYSVNVTLANEWMSLGCYHGSYHYNYYDYHRASPSPEEEITQEKCLEGEALAVMLFRSIHAVLIIISVLELCLVISSAVLGIKAVRRSQKGENKGTDEPEYYNSLLEEVTINPVV